MSSSKRLFLTCLIALFPAYTFFQMGMLNVLGNYWLEENLAMGGQTAYLSSAYLYADAFMLIFAGVLLDHVKLSKLIPLALGLNIIGTFMILLHQTLFWLIMSRAISGLGHAFALLALFRVAILLFDEKKHGFVIGLGLTIAIAGGFMSEGPFDRILLICGWKIGLGLDVFIGLALLFLMSFLLRRYAPLLSQGKGEKLLHDYFSGFAAAAKKPVNYLCAIYICCMSMPLMIYGLIWGNDYLEMHDHFSSVQASFASGLLFAGLAVGFPVVGWVSDHFKHRSYAMVFGAAITFFMLVLFNLTHKQSFLMVCLVLFVMSFFSASQAIGYTMIGEQNPRASASSAMGFSNVILMGLTATIQLALNHFI